MLFEGSERVLSFHYKINLLKHTAIIISGFKNILVYFESSGWKYTFCSYVSSSLFVYVAEMIIKAAGFIVFTTPLCFPLIFIWFM